MSVTVTEGRRIGILSVSEIMKRLEDSEVRYRIRSVPSVTPMEQRQYARRLWPQRIPELGVPIRDGPEDAGGMVRELQIAPEVAAAMKVAEEHFRAKRWAEAEAGYLRALRLDPNTCLAQLYLGDAVLWQGRIDEARSHYLEARKHNPIDHASYFFEGSALLALDRVEEALDAFAWPLALRPWREALRDALHNRLPKRGYRLGAELLLPLAFAERREDGEIELVVSEKAPHGLAFAACKAMWLGEPEHRQAVLGKREHDFSSRKRRSASRRCSRHTQRSSRRGGRRRTRTWSSSVPW